MAVKFRYESFYQGQRQKFGTPPNENLQITLIMDPTTDPYVVSEGGLNQTGASDPDISEGGLNDDMDGSNIIWESD